MINLKGCFTALVTPFDGSGLSPNISQESFVDLLLWQKEAGVTGVVPCGTTGESPTLSTEEYEWLYSQSVEAFGSQVLAGAGSNYTQKAIELAQLAEACGAGGVLSVCPYYNKPNQEGIFRHYAEIAESIEIPIVLYNVPGRTGGKIEPLTALKLAEQFSNIVGIKEASGVEKNWEVINENKPKEFHLISGNDDNTLQMMQHYSASGVISVASNIAPKTMQHFTQLGLNGKWNEMQKLNTQLSPLFRDLFIDTNPIMPKTALNMLGKNAGGFRLPLCETNQKNTLQLQKTLNELTKTWME